MLQTNETMENTLDKVLEELLAAYTDAKGITFHSLELPISRAQGEHTDLLEKYKDIPMLSVDEAFHTTFTFIITSSGSVVIFFIDQLHFVSVFTANTDPNKELAARIYEQFHEPLEKAIQHEYETSATL